MSPSLNDGAKVASIQIPIIPRKAFYFAQLLGFIPAI